MNELAFESLKFKKKSFWFDVMSQNLQGNFVIFQSLERGKILLILKSSTPINKLRNLHIFGNLKKNIGQITAQIEHFGPAKPLSPFEKIRKEGYKKLFRGRPRVKTLKLFQKQRHTCSMMLLKQCSLGVEAGSLSGSKLFVEEDKSKLIR